MLVSFIFIEVKRQNIYFTMDMVLLYINIEDFYYKIIFFVLKNNDVIFTTQIFYSLIKK